MLSQCRGPTSAGKGKSGSFVERCPRIRAAGVPTAQRDELVLGSLQHYMLKDEVDALLSDSITPPETLKHSPHRRRPVPQDERNAGPFGKVSKIINPPIKTKFQTLVDDFKDTAYSSYWKKPLGGTGDVVPQLREGFDASGTTFGKKSEFHGRLYDVVMPKDFSFDDIPESKSPGVRAGRGYCAPPYAPGLTLGRRSLVDKRGIYAKRCLTDDRTLLGTSRRAIVDTIFSKHRELNRAGVGEASARNTNISLSPDGYSFGKLKAPDNLPECLTYCRINPSCNFFRACLSHLNSLRMRLSKRFSPSFFRGFYLNLKYYDADSSGWLPKDVVYDSCVSRLIRVEPALLEPLLSSLQVFDGSKIEYKKFVDVINFREPYPEIPKIPDLPPECLDFHTTYTDMIKSSRKRDDSKMAGVPSGRYFDLDYPVTPERCCTADRKCLPHESDARACLSPSVLTALHVDHRDMHAQREPGAVRSVFEATGESFDDESFDAVWAEAKRHHTRGWVCYETFRRALEKYLQNNKEKTN